MSQNDEVGVVRSLLLLMLPPVLFYVHVATVVVLVFNGLTSLLGIYFTVLWWAHWVRSPFCRDVFTKMSRRFAYGMAFACVLGPASLVFSL